VSGNAAPGGQPRTRAGGRCGRLFRQSTSMPLGLRRLPAPAADPSGFFGFGGRDPSRPRTSPTCLADLADLFFAAFVPGGALRLTAIGFSPSTLGNSASSNRAILHDHGRSRGSQFVPGSTKWPFRSHSGTGARVPDGRCGITAHDVPGSCRPSVLVPGGRPCGVHARTGALSAYARASV
jgi:hypothetical protein